MQLRNIIAVLFFLIANISFASAAEDGVIIVTMTTSVEVTSTVYVGTVTVTGRPTTTHDIPLTTNTVVEPTATTGSHNSTAPTPSTPTKDSDSSAATFSGSIRLVAAAGAIVAVLGML